MKIDFDDHSYIELILSSPGKIAIVLGAKDPKNPLSIVINSAEITIQQLADLVNALNIPIPIFNRLPALKDSNIK
jgi:hypothetical protein